MNKIIIAIFTLLIAANSSIFFPKIQPAKVQNFSNDFTCSDSGVAQWNLQNQNITDSELSQAVLTLTNGTLASKCQSMTNSKISDFYLFLSNNNVSNFSPVLLAMNQTLVGFKLLFIGVGNNPANFNGFQGYSIGDTVTSLTIDTFVLPSSVGFGSTNNILKYATNLTDLELKVRFTSVVDFSTDFLMLSNFPGQLRRVKLTIPADSQANTPTNIDTLLINLQSQKEFRHFEMDFQKYYIYDNDVQSLSLLLEKTSPTIQNLRLFFQYSSITNQQANFIQRGVKKIVQAGGQHIYINFEDTAVTQSSLNSVYSYCYSQLGSNCQIFC